MFTQLNFLSSLRGVSPKFTKANVVAIHPLFGLLRLSLAMTRNRKAGFSMMQMSIVLAIAGLVLASTLPGGSGGSDADKVLITKTRMQKIEEATKSYMAKNYHRPFPSDLTAATNSADFAAESVPSNDDLFLSTYFGHNSIKALFEMETINGTGNNPGSNLVAPGSMSVDTPNVRNGWIATNTLNSSYNAPITKILSDTSYIWGRAADTGYNNEFTYLNPLITGGVPTKTLGLPDEYALDGFGRRMVYMVDVRTTNQKGCMDLQGKNLEGYLALATSTNFDTSTYDHAMWALLSYGKDGQGAMSAQGSGSLSTRIKTGNLDASTTENAFYDATSNQNTSYTNVRGLVNAAQSSAFDDIIWTSNDSKNICGAGSVATKKDFRIDTASTSAGTTSVASGDVNGDGFQDMIIGDAAANEVYVIFGRKDGWPTPLTSAAPPIYDARLTSSLDGTNGFKIVRGPSSGTGSTMTKFGQNLLTGDFNGDGYSDILIGGQPALVGTPGYIIVFGAAAWPAIHALGNTYPTLLTAFTRLPAGILSHAAVGDVNGDGYDDIALPYYNSGNRLAIIYGRATATIWPTTFNIATWVTLATSRLNGDTVGLWLSYGQNESTTVAPYIPDATYPRFALCDVNADGYSDVIIPGLNIDITGATKNSRPQFFIMLGPVDSAYLPYSARLSTITFADEVTNDTVRSVFCKDIDNDGYDDVIVQKIYGSTEYLYVTKGNTSFTGAYIQEASNSGYDIRFDLTTSDPSWRDTTTSPTLAFGDVNNDGRTDIFISSTLDDASVTPGSTFTIASDTSGSEDRINTGASYILYQPSIAWTGNINFFSKNFAGVDGIRIIGEDEDKIAVQKATDINKDGKTDLLVKSDVTTTKSGGAYVVWGKDDWAATPSAAATSYDLNCLRDTSAAHCSTQLGVE